MDNSFRSVGRACLVQKKLKTKPYTVAVDAWFGVEIKITYFERTSEDFDGY